MSPDDPKPGAIWLRQYRNNKAKGHNNNDLLFYQCLLFKKVDKIKIEENSENNKKFKINNKFSKNIIDIYFDSDKTKTKNLVEYYTHYAVTQKNNIILKKSNIEDDIRNQKESFDI